MRDGAYNRVRCGVPATKITLLDAAMSEPPYPSGRPWSLQQAPPGLGAALEKEQGGTAGTSFSCAVVVPHELGTALIDADEVKRGGRVTLEFFGLPAPKTGGQGRD